MQSHRGRTYLPLERTVYGMPTYRPIPDDDREVFSEYVSYAFVPEQGREEYDPDHRHPRMTLGSPRGLYPDPGAGSTLDSSSERPLCVCRHYWFEVSVRGQLHLAPGLSMVASPPEHRRSGHVRTLLKRSLEEYRDREAHFSVLWPFRYRFYRQYGWETASRHLTVECDPADLAFARDRLRSTDDHSRTSPGGTFRPVEADDYRILEPVYDDHCERYDLSIARDADWWRRHVLTRWGTDPYVYVWERDGEPAGYLVYTIEGDRGERTMTVSELRYRDPEASFALLSFCHNHGSQVASIRFRLPVDTPLFDAAADPDAFDVSLETGAMVRLVDVGRTLSALSYPTVDGARRMTFEVTDPLAEWNEGRFTLEVTDDSATCVRVDDAAVDVRLEVATLSQLAVGATSVEALERAGRLETTDTGALERLESLFPKRVVYLGEGF